MVKVEDYAKLEHALGHTFASHRVLLRSLTHSSVTSAANAKSRSRGGAKVRTANGDAPDGDNERLEFLGDRVLGLAIAELLTVRFPDASEGELARRFNWLVCGDACAAVANDIDLGAVLIVSDAEATLSGRGRDSILADGMEAVLAAVFLDAGFNKARDVVRRLWEPYIDRLPTVAVDAKTALQEWAQGQGLALPRYMELKRIGPDHAPKFTAEVRVENYPPAVGEGASKRVAEQAAAGTFLVREGVRESTNLNGKH